MFRWRGVEADAPLHCAEQRRRTLRRRRHWCSAHLHVRGDGDAKNVDDLLPATWSEPLRRLQNVGRLAVYRDECVTSRVVDRREALTDVLDTEDVAGHECERGQQRDESVDELDKPVRFEEWRVDSL